MHQLLLSLLLYGVASVLQHEDCKSLLYHEISTVQVSETCELSLENCTVQIPCLPGPTESTTSSSFEKQHKEGKGPFNKVKGAHIIQGDLDFLCFLSFFSHVCFTVLPMLGASANSTFPIKRRPATMLKTYGVGRATVVAIHVYDLQQIGGTKGFNCLQLKLGANAQPQLLAF